MTTGTLNEVLRHLHELTDGCGAPDSSDGELLERFRARRDEAAFAALVRRHGPMVWGVCRRVLRDRHQSEDAFQATFLVLVHKAGSVRRHESVASWLYGVAYRVALKARSRAATRQARERRFVEMRRQGPLDEMTGSELRAVLDEEVNRLPEKYRAAVVLCYLEGKTHAQAARQLGCPRTSLSSRLGRARALLRQRLGRRGLALPSGLLTLALAGQAAAEGVPALLLLSTVRAGAWLAAGNAAAAGVSPQAAALAAGVLATMHATKTTLAAVLVLALAVSAATALALGRQPPPSRPRESRTEKAPALADKGPPGLFRDVTADSGIAFAYRNGEEANHHAILESLGGGVALLDYDGDGLLDVFLPGGGDFAGAERKVIRGRPSKLYKNLGNFKFKDVTKEVGLDRIDFYTHGCAVADYDRDGWPDLLVTGWGRVALFHNEPDGKGGRRLVDVTAKAGLGKGITWATSAAWADLDGDGWPDLYVCQYVDWSFANHPACTYDGKSPDVCPPKRFNGLPHKVYRNNGDGTFTDVSAEAGLRKSGADAGKGLGVLAVDVNLDGKPDVYVANDTVDNFLYVNRSVPGKVRFEEVGLTAGVARDDNGTPTGSKGLDAFDYENTGRPALWVSNDAGEHHSLFRNDLRDGRLAFLFASRGAGVAALGPDQVGWGTGALDFDHDGWADLFIANGHVLRFPTGRAKRAQRPDLLRNRGGKFVAVSDQGGPYFRAAHRARGAALGDLDNDGRIDLVISHLNEPVVVLRNEAPAGTNHWLGVELVGKRRGDVTGARLVLEVEGLPRQARFAKGGGSFASANDPRHVFGLGKAKRPGKLTVRWPSGQEQSWEGLKADRYWRLVEGESDR
jgi:RNA polymerase sigma factor (sigma-70 family)